MESSPPWCPGPGLPSVLPAVSPGGAAPSPGRAVGEPRGGRQKLGTESCGRCRGEGIPQGPPQAQSLSLTKRPPQPRKSPGSPPAQPPGPEPCSAAVLIPFLPTVAQIPAALSGLRPLSTPLLCSAASVPSSSALSGLSYRPGSLEPLLCVPTAPIGPGRSLGTGPGSGSPLPSARPSTRPGLRRAQRAGRDDGCNGQV